MKIRNAIAACLLLLPLGAAAQIVPVGTEFQVNSYTTDAQVRPSVAAGADGAFVVAWESRGQDGNFYGVFGQRYDSAGQAAGTEFQVNNYTFASQTDPAVAAGADGAFVVAWQSGGQDGNFYGVFGQRYDSAGQAAGSEFQVNSFTPYSQAYPAVAAGADGAFVVAWQSYLQDGDGYGVFGQRYDSAGQAAGSEFQVNSFTPYFQAYPAVAAGADGAIVVAWQSYLQDGDGYGVFGQRYDSAGQAAGTEFQVNSFTLAKQTFPAVAAGADGVFVVAWSSYTQDGSVIGMFGQRYDSAGQAAGSEFQVNSYTPNFQMFPSVAAGADGAFVVAWSSYSQDGSGFGMFGQRYDSTGQPAGTEFQVNSYTPNDQVLPSVAAGADGAFVVAWSDGRFFPGGQDGSYLGVFGQRLAVPTSTPTPTPTPSVASCPLAPSGTCATPGKAQLQLKLNASDTKDKLKWKFGDGPLLMQSDFGNPTTTASYALCIYDDGALAVALQVGPSGTLWSAVGSKGYQYKDGGGTSSGVTKMKLLGGEAGLSKMQLKGKGSNLPMPTPVSGTRFFAQTTAVIAQLREANGDCYETAFTDADTKKNDGTQYKAKK